MSLNVPARELHVVPDNENVKGADAENVPKESAASGLRAPPRCSREHLPGGAEIFRDRYERSDNGFDRNMQRGGNTPDAQGIAVRAVFQGTYFARGEATGHGKLLDRIAGKITRCQDLFGERSIGFVIGIGL
ncbi:hypothetical protein AWN88_05765 [Agrobacterium tumefaciens]|nr:hypothetical protein AWN88_05765 [Agrobacterium tumefaciens]